MALEISTHEQYKLLELAKNAIDDRLKNHAQLKEPRVMIICGSGLGGIVNVLDLEPKLEVGYSEIPGFRSSTVPGHAGKLVFGLIGSKKVPVMCMVGRLHFYEGYSFQETTFPIRVAKLLGVSTLIVTNAAGGIRESFKPGDLMIINDHINFPGLAGFHSLRGPNLDKFGTRFQALSDAYGHDLRRLFHVKSKELKVARKIHEGTYVFVAGPSFETRAEVRMIRTMGGDAVGMSTVPEVVVARHCGLDVLALSLITNGGNGNPPPSAFEEKPTEQEDNANHDDVLKAADEASHDVQNIIAATVNEL